MEQMIFYLNYLNHENQFREFDISFKKKLNKNEKLFFQYLLRIYSKLKENFLEIEKNELLEFLNLKNDDELIKYLDKFINLKIHYSFRDFENTLYSGAFNILDSYFVQKENVVIILSKEINLSFSKNNFFNQIDLQTIFNFEYQMSLKIYLKLLETKQAEGILNFDLNELKQLLEIEGAYERFYDFEKKILNLIINDLNEFSKYKISYTKIKNGDFKSARVTGIEFQYVNEILKKLNEEANELILSIKDLITNFNIVYEEIRKNLKKNNYEYVANNILFAKENYENEFDSFLIRSLNENLYLKKLNERKHFTISKYVNKPYKLYEELHKLLSELHMEEVPVDHLWVNSFTKKLFLLRNGETSIFKNDKMQIDVTYYEKQESKIDVFFFSE